MDYKKPSKIMAAVVASLLVGQPVGRIPSPTSAITEK